MTKAPGPQPVICIPFVSLVAQRELRYRPQRSATMMMTYGIVRVFMIEPIMLHSAFQSMIVHVMVTKQTSILLLAGTTGQKEVYGGQISTRATFNTFRGCLRALVRSLATVTTIKDVTFYATQREKSADALTCSAQTNGCALSWRVRTRTYGSALRVCARARRSDTFAFGNHLFQLENTYVLYATSAEALPFAFTVQHPGRKNPGSRAVTIASSARS